MAIDTRFPAWMAQRNWATSDSVSRDLQFGMQFGQRNREFEAAQELRGSVLRSQEAYRQTQINTLLMRQKQMEAEQTDAALVTEWMKDPRQPPPVGLRTPKGLQAVTQVQKAFSETEMGSKFAAVRKAYTDKIKELDATGALKVQQLLNVNQGEITPEIAAIIDAETARMAGTTADIQVLDEMGEPFVKGGANKPAFLRSTKTGALHRLPQDWSGDAMPLTDVEGNVIGYGVRNASGGITQLREHKTTTPPMEPARKAAMNLEMKTVQSWWDGLTAKERAKPENQALMRQKIAEVEGKYTMQPAAPATAPAAPVNTNDPLGLFQ